jgi:hypothetical protein
VDPGTGAAAAAAAVVVAAGVEEVGAGGVAGIGAAVVEADAGVEEGGVGVGVGVTGAVWGGTKRKTAVVAALGSRWWGVGACVEEGVYRGVVK